MSVKRYSSELRHGNFHPLTESPGGNYMLHSDYAELEARNNALEERIRRINVWHECDKCDCLFIPGGLGAETSCATCIKLELDALREAVNAYFDCIAYAVAHPSTLDKMNAARAEVDRLIAEGHAE